MISWWTQSSSVIFLFSLEVKKADCTCTLRVRTGPTEGADAQNSSTRMCAAEKRALGKSLRKTTDFHRIPICKCATDQ